jgi:hypothetical protein
MVLFVPSTQTKRSLPSQGTNAGSRFCSCWSSIILCLMVTVHQTLNMILNRVELFLPENQQYPGSATTWVLPQSGASLSAPSSDAVVPQNPIMYDATPALPNPPYDVFEGVHARAFRKWNQTSMPCVPAEDDWKLRQKDPSTNGFIFAKPYKTGSSTASGVNLRMARNVAMRFNHSGLLNYSSSHDFTMCKARSDHVWSSSKYWNRDPGSTFLWTILRDPDSRVVSQFFHFEVSRDKIEPTDSNFAEYLTNGPLPIMHEYYLRSLSLRKYEPGRGDPVETANAILNSYNFVGVTERMDESFVAMAMLLGLPLADVLYLAAKSRGGFDDAGRASDASKPTPCTYIWPSFVSEGMQSQLDSDDWRNKSHWDRVLHRAANRSLDLTIDYLGRALFSEQLDLYRRALARSREVCLRNAVFPCSSGGIFTPEEKTTCLWKDSGCGYQCLDEVANELRLWEVPT